MPSLSWHAVCPEHCKISDCVSNKGLQLRLTSKSINVCSLATAKPPDWLRQWFPNFLHLADPPICTSSPLGAMVRSCGWERGRSQGPSCIQAGDQRPRPGPRLGVSLGPGLELCLGLETKDGATTGGQGLGWGWGHG